MKKPSAMGTAQPIENPIDKPFPVLISYHYLRKEPENQIARLLDPANGLEWMLDSGAFSAKNSGAEIKLDEYMEFLRRYPGAFGGGYVALDVLGDPKATEKNLDVMYAEGFEPMPVHVWGDTEKRMDYLFERSSKICLGGFKRPGRGPAPREYVVQKMRWAKQRDVHWLGFTTRRFITSLRPHSCDSASWLQSRMYGKASFYVGNGKFIGVAKHERQQVQRMVSERILDRYLVEAQVDWNEFLSEKGWSGEDSVSHRITSLGYLRYVLDLRRRFGVRYLMALGSMLDFNRVNKLVQRVRSGEVLAHA